MSRRARRHAAPTAIATAIAVTVTLGLVLAAPVQAAARDTDGDGMPDRWEKAHGLDWRHRDARADADHDGVSNIREFRLGLDPQRADQVCSALQIALGATDPSECRSMSVTELLR